MSEVWLHGNRRIFYAAAVIPAALAIIGVLLALVADETSLGVAVRWIGWGLALISGIVFAILIALARQPRLAYRDGNLLVYLRPTGPIRVPIDIVEAFLVGQGPVVLSGTNCQQGSETITVVIRLADRAAAWSHVAVHPVLGSWCDGYITLRGTWCEPLSVDAVVRLNQRLSEVQRTGANLQA